MLFDVGNDHGTARAEIVLGAGNAGHHVHGHDARFGLLRERLTRSAFGGLDGHIVCIRRKGIVDLVDENGGADRAVRRRGDGNDNGRLEHVGRCQEVFYVLLFFLVGRRRQINVGVQVAVLRVVVRGRIAVVVGDGIDGVVKFERNVADLVKRFVFRVRGIARQQIQSRVDAVQRNRGVRHRRIDRIGQQRGAGGPGKTDAARAGTNLHVGGRRHLHERT